MTETKLKIEDTFRHAEVEERFRFSEEGLYVFGEVEFFFKREGASFSRFEIKKIPLGHSLRVAGYEEGNSFRWNDLATQAPSLFDYMKENMP